MKPVPYNQQPQQVIKGANREIASFATDVSGRNIDYSVVKSFGIEWEKFHQFSDKDINDISEKYFDIVTDQVMNEQSYCVDIGCGTGRWSKYLHKRAGFFECVDPSDAILVADKVLQDATNVRFSKASTDNLPFPDETFDFGMSIGVLHHIPNTTKAMTDCVRKIKMGGHFYVYLYYALDNRGWMFRTIFFFVNTLRKIVSSLPSGLKKFACDLITIFLYMPVILFGRFMKWLGFKKFASMLPLECYHTYSFFVIRNDALDRFGTRLEQRFTRKQVIAMMQESGLSDIVVSDKFPYWHAIGRRAG